MHSEILNQKQNNLLPLLKEFSGDFGLVGGTAIALHLGHRRSVDFDLFTSKKDLDHEKIRATVKELCSIEEVLVETAFELTILVNGVKLTFLRYPFSIEFKENFNNIINLADLITLSATKAYTLGRRAKWKDYVDLYFVFKRYTLDQVVSKAREMFKNEFSEKLFRTQLTYYKDVDFSEEIDYMDGFETDDEKIKDFLAKISLDKGSST
ncbi:nucleotidyl transferase AbiEii/AbiGii toxin family protein [Patescibacteria group bacterium]|nr:nucleotidyl transferase AbiEii/AbiGii toxin family protein [Patescibacteria group bacterium]